MRFLLAISRAYPWRTSLTLLAMVLAGLREGVGLSLLAPMLSVAMGEPSQAGTDGPSGFSGTLLAMLIGLGIAPTLGPLLIVILGCLLLKGGLLLLARLQVGYTVAHVATDLRLTLLRSLLAARWEYYVRQPAGSLANAVGTEAIRVSVAYLQGTMVAAVLVQAIVYTGVAVMIAWQATLGALAAGAALLYGVHRLIRMAHRAGTRQTQLLKSLLARLTDSLQSVKPLKAMAQEELVGPVLESENSRLNRALRREVLSTEALASVQEPMVAAVIAAGVWLALTQWGVPFATVTVVAFLLARLLGLLAKAQRYYQRMRASESAYWSLQDAIRDARDAQESAPGGLAPTLRTAIRFDLVSFAYEGTQVLEKASLSIPAGSFTAIVGPSGAGKTTIVDLVTALLRPQQGEIWIDDLSLERLDLKRWRRLIGYVPQETFLLHDTVLHNITLGDPALKEADAQAALRAAGAWDFVAQMPQGLLSSVGERGTALSGGQRQRIAIARGLVHKPSLLILDEVTSALDRESEAAICSTLQQLKGAVTILAISHQPAFFEAADRVYRLRQGALTLVKDGNATSAELNDLSEEATLTGQADPAGKPESQRGAHRGS